MKKLIYYLSSIFFLFLSCKENQEINFSKKAKLMNSELISLPSIGNQMNQLEQKGKDFLGSIFGLLKAVELKIKHFDENDFNNESEFNNESNYLNQIIEKTLDLLTTIYGKIDMLLVEESQILEDLKNQKFEISKTALTKAEHALKNSSLIPEDLNTELELIKKINSHDKFFKSSEMYARLFSRFAHLIYFTTGAHVKKSQYKEILDSSILAGLILAFILDTAREEGFFIKVKDFFTCRKINILIESLASQIINKKLEKFSMRSLNGVIQKRAGMLDESIELQNNYNELLSLLISIDTWIAKIKTKEQNLVETQLKVIFFQAFVDEDHPNI